LALMLTASPISEATVVLALAVAVDAAALLALRQPRPRPMSAPENSVVLPIGKTGGSVYLRRRTVPGLRLRHPAGVIEAQTRWRQASEARLRGRRIVASAHPAD
jgi:hypothetical protein